MNCARGSSLESGNNQSERERTSRVPGATASYGRPYGVGVLFFPGKRIAPRRAKKIIYLSRFPRGYQFKLVDCLATVACAVSCGPASLLLAAYFNSAVSRRNPQGHRPVFGSNRCEPYRLHFLNCLGLPPSLPFFALAACLAGVLANPPIRPPRRPSSAAALVSVDSSMPGVLT